MLLHPKSRVVSLMAKQTKKHCKGLTSSTKTIQRNITTVHQGKQVWSYALSLQDQRLVNLHHHILQTLWLTSSYIIINKTHNRFPHDNNKEICTCLRCNTWSSRAYVATFSSYFNWAYFCWTWANFVLIICSCCLRYVVLVFKPRHILSYLGKLFIQSQMLMSIKYSKKYYFDISSVHKLQSTQPHRSRRLRHK